MNREYIDYIEQLLDLAQLNDIFCLTSRAFNEFSAAVLEALEKQMPMKPKAVEDKIWCCPTCWNNLLQIWSEYPTKKMELNRGLPYCLGCGQVIDWSEE